MVIAVANKDCCFTHKNIYFRFRAGAIIVEDESVLLVTNELEDYYYSVGGGVHLLENSMDAVKREVLEETGIEYEIDRLAVIHENFFNENKGTLKDLECHEIAFYYLMKSKGNKKLNSNSYTHGVKEKLEFISIDNLDKHKAFPTFLKEYLQNKNENIVHIITDERK